jgi:hypothetical protein
LQAVRRIDSLIATLGDGGAGEDSGAGKMAEFDVFQRFRATDASEALGASRVTSITAGACADISGFIAALALFFVLAQPAGAADHGQLGPTSPEVKAWAATLENKLREGCCSTADGWKPEEVEYDMKGNKYRVKIDGEWYEVPSDAVVDVPNRFGFAVVWYYRSWLNGNKPSVSIRCFIPGAGG